MSTALLLILVIVGAYLAAHVAFEWLARRYLIVSGAEYLLLGFLLGPQVSGAFGPNTIDSFAPFMVLALGWIGVVVGAQFYLPELIRIPRLSYQVAFAEAIATFALLSLTLGAVLVWLVGLSPTEASVPALALGAIGTTSSPSGAGIIARRLGARGPVVRQLQLTTAVEALVAITAFAVLFATLHREPVATPRPPTATEWVVITVAIGLVGGALFHLFLGDERKIDRLFVALAGAIILATGAAAYLRLSPLLPTLIIGATLINTSRNREAIREVLTRLERPLYFVLLIFAGAAWSPGTGAWLTVVLIFLLVRPLIKLGTAAAAAAGNGTLPQLGAGWGRALLGQGGLAVALALDFTTYTDGLFADAVFTAALASVLVTDVAGARLAGGVVRSYESRKLRSIVDTTAAPPAAAREEV